MDDGTGTRRFGHEGGSSWNALASILSCEKRAHDIEVHLGSGRIANSALSVIPGLIVNQRRDVRKGKWEHLIGP
jgi:hypothetical protein